jgi:hypothetical protein
MAPPLLKVLFPPRRKRPQDKEELDAIDELVTEA